MLIDIRTVGFTLTDAIRSHVEERTATALGWAGRFIGKVTVRLEDVNADRGGIDKRCRIVADVKRRQPIITEVVSNDLYAAIDEAESRMRQVARRRLERRISLQRKIPHRPMASLMPGMT